VVEPFVVEPKKGLARCRLSHKRRPFDAVFGRLKMGWFAIAEGKTFFFGTRSAKIW